MHRGASRLTQALGCTEFLVQCSALARFSSRVLRRTCTSFAAWLACLSLVHARKLSRPESSHTDGLAHTRRRAGRARQPQRAPASRAQLTPTRRWRACQAGHDRSASLVRLPMHSSFLLVLSGLGMLQASAAHLPNCSLKRTAADGLR